jgi:hypothetical protein
VFASDEGVVKLVTGLADLKSGQKGVDFRVWVGDRLEENFRAQILHRLPYNTDRKKPGIEKEVKFAVLRKKDSRWKGVHRGGVESTEPGIHEVRIVVEGSVTSQIRTNGNEFVTTDIPYRREQIVRWMVNKA